MKKSRLLVGITSSLMLMLLPANQANAYSHEELRIFTKSSYELIGLDAARNLGLTGKDQVVVFIDDGIEVDHPYIKNNVLDGFCSSEAACGNFHLKTGKDAGGIFPKTSSSFHGNMVAGIIAGEANSVALGGVAPNAKLISITNTDGGMAGLNAAFDWVLEAKKKYNIVAVSGSFGATNAGLRSDILSCHFYDFNEKIKALADAGIIPVFAAGNESNIVKVSHPACLPFVVSVGALNYKGQLQDYSNVGGNLTVLAPSDVMTASREGNYMLGGGTSAAAPVVAGVIALLKEAKPSATFEEVKNSLQSTDKYLDDVYWKGLPILNVSTAISSLKSGKFTKPAISVQKESIEDKAKAEAEAKLAKDAQTKAEAEAKLAKDAEAKTASIVKKLGEATGTVIEHKAGCHGLPGLTGEQAEVEAKQPDGSWRKVSTYVYWEISKDCPANNPTRWWAIIDTDEVESLRWKFWSGSNPPFYPAETSYLNVVKQAQTKAEAEAKLAKDAQAKAEAEAKLAKDAQAKAEADFKSSQAILSQIQAETSKLKADFEVIRVQTSELVSMSTLLQKQNDTLKKKLSVICKAKPKPKGC